MISELLSKITNWLSNRESEKQHDRFLAASGYSPAARATIADLEKRNCNLAKELAKYRAYQTTLKDFVNE